MMRRAQWFFMSLPIVVIREFLWGNYMVNWWSGCVMRAAVQALSL